MGVTEDISTCRTGASKIDRRVCEAAARAGLGDLLQRRGVCGGGLLSAASNLTSYTGKTQKVRNKPF